MSSKFDSSFLESVPRNNSYVTADENIYSNTEECIGGGEYCGLSPNHYGIQNSAFTHPSTSTHSDQERQSNTQTARGTPAEKKKHHKNDTLQDAARYIPEHLPAVSSSNRVNRARLASDSEIRHTPVSSRYPDVSGSRTRMTDTQTRSAAVPRSTVRVQPNNTSQGDRIPTSTVNSEGLPRNNNNVIINQVQPRGMLPREPVSRGRHEGQDTHRNLSDGDTRGNSSRNPLPKPRRTFPNESQRGTDKRQDLMQNRGALDKERKIPIPRERNSRTRETHTDKLDLNMNRTRVGQWQRNDETELGHKRVGRPVINKQPSREEWSLNQGLPRREQIIEETRGKQQHIPLDISSSRFQQNGNMERETKFGGKTNARVGFSNVPPPLSLAFRERRTDELEMTSMVPPLSPRIHQLRREETPVKYPLLGLAFPRPHSFDVPENKTKILRTLSSPELRVSSIEGMLNIRNDRGKSSGNESHRHQHNHNSNHFPNQQNTQTTSACPKGIVKTKGKRSKSLPVASNLRSSSVGRRGPSADSSPLRYFAYLGKRFQFRERLLSAHNVLSARPVILTSTSVISPNVTTNFCQQLEEQEFDSCDESIKHKGACQDLIDCCTCMCCVEGLFYHCTKDDDSEGYYAEHPCSCNGPGNQCVGRWSVLGLLSIAMPCLLCYLPIQGCKRGVEYFRRKSNTPDSEQ